ncbi:Uncharacterised protein [Mycobacteroides abscessus subsp. massiliense]|nr:Uncharacterised protein [Mycobacteroides abscessus subsp. massiliense]
MRLRRVARAHHDNELHREPEQQQCGQHREGHQSAPQHLAARTFTEEPLHQKKNRPRVHVGLTLVMRDVRYSRTMANSS